LKKYHLPSSLQKECRGILKPLLLHHRGNSSHDIILPGAEKAAPYPIGDTKRKTIYTFVMLRFRDNKIIKRFKVPPDRVADRNCRSNVGQPSSVADDRPIDAWSSSFFEITRK